MSDATPNVGRIYFQQEPNEDLQMPWQVIVDRDQTIVYGRPDAHYLVGFTPVGVQDVTVHGKNALEDPALAVGLCPVFTGYDGKMFVIDLPVKWCTVYAGDETAVAMLKEREAVMREAGGW